MKKSYKLLLSVAISCLSCLVFSSLNAQEVSSEDVDLNILAKAWKIPTGGSHNRPYYSLQFGDVIFEGERNWQDRWDLIDQAIDAKDKRVLELGCNIGIASVYLLKYQEAYSSVGVDRPNSELAKNDMPRLVEASNLLQEAFGVDMDFVQLDFNRDDYQSILGDQYDLVICMSILKWVEDKDRFLDYLSNFNEILYEGHDTDAEEIERFQQIGFDQYEVIGATHVGTSYPENSKRTLIHFWKS